MARCSYCDSVIIIGQNCLNIDIPQLKDELFCCEKCAKAALEEKLDEIYEAHVEEDELEDPDPYSRYGVSRLDF